MGLQWIPGVWYLDMYIESKSHALQLQHNINGEFCHSYTISSIHVVLFSQARAM